MGPDQVQEIFAGVLFYVIIAVEEMIIISFRQPDSRVTGL